MRNTENVPLPTSNQRRYGKKIQYKQCHRCANFVSRLRRNALSWLQAIRRDRFRCPPVVASFHGKGAAASGGGGLDRQDSNDVGTGCAVIGQADKIAQC